MLNGELAQIKSEISRSIGSRVFLESNKGRQKSTITRGVIKDAYPGVFTVLLSGGEPDGRTVSYSYTDVLTGAVEVTVCE